MSGKPKGAIGSPRPDGAFRIPKTTPDSPTPPSPPVTDQHLAAAAAQRNAAAGPLPSATFRVSGTVTVTQASLQSAPAPAAPAAAASTTPASGGSTGGGTGGTSGTSSRK